MKSASARCHSEERTTRQNQVRCGILLVADVETVQIGETGAVGVDGKYVFYVCTSVVVGYFIQSVVRENQSVYWISFIAVGVRRIGGGYGEIIQIYKTGAVGANPEHT